MELAMIESDLVPFAQLAPAHLDRGTFFGDGVYEVIRSYHGRLFALDEHLARLRRNLGELRITGMDGDTVRDRVCRAFTAAGLENASVYLHVTRGAARREHTWGEALQPRFFLTVTALPDPTPLRECGVPVSTHPDWRWKRCDIKSLNLLPNILAKQDAKRKGCFEAVLVDDRGAITEGASSAFLAVCRGTLVTRALGPEILPSITRLFVLRLAATLGLPVQERALTPAEAAAADELVLGVTTKDVLPIVTFDGHPIGSGRPGDVTRRLMDAFAALVRG